MTSTPSSRRVNALIAILGGSGLLHFTIPQPYQKIVPPGLGDPRALVLGSGAAELACAAMVATPRLRRTGALLSAGLFVAVFPANFYAVKVMGGNSKLGRAAAIARLPLQLPMITAALKVARDS
jgi:uncharacterized membrane protein